MTENTDEKMPVESAVEAEEDVKAEPKKAKKKASKAKTKTSKDTEIPEPKTAEAEDAGTVTILPGANTTEEPNAPEMSGIEPPQFAYNPGTQWIAIRHAVVEGVTVNPGTIYVVEEVTGELPKGPSKLRYVVRMRLVRGNGPYRVKIDDALDGFHPA